MASRTMVYLEPGQLRALKNKARAEGVSVAELIRRAVGRSLDGEGTIPAPGPDVYARLVGLGASGSADISDHHDDWLTAALTGRRNDR